MPEDGGKHPRLLISDPVQVRAELRRLTGGKGVADLRTDRRTGRVDGSMGAELSLKHLAAVAAAFESLFDRALSGREPEMPDDSEKPKPKFLRSEILHLDNGVVSAVGKMFYNYDWSRKMVHSSDMLFAMGELVDSLLKDGDVIVAAPVMRFLGTVRHDLKMFAVVGDDDAVLKSVCPEGKPDVKVIFDVENADGSAKKIQLVAFQNENAVDEHVHGSNQYVDFLISGFDCWESVRGGDGRDKKVFALSQDFAGQEYDCNVYEMLHIVMEIVMNAFCKLRKFGKGVIPKAKEDLAAGFEFTKIPTFRGIESDCQLELTVCTDAMVQKPSGFRFFPIKFVLKRGREIVGEGVYTNAQSCNDEVAAAYGEKLR